jgi:multimeric flavodoxin WrbA
MKVVAINSSPKMGNGNTALILDPFLDGMRTAGAEVDLFYTKKLKINPCEGEFSCWLKTPGECFQTDDMAKLLPKMRDADIWVLASPVYCNGLNAQMKTVLDRIIPMVHPFFELRDGHCRHPLRRELKVGKVVLVSNCGFWEMDNFNPVLTHMQYFCQNGAEFAGALLRPHGEALKAMVEKGMPVSDIFDAAQEAGRQLVEDGRISLETLDVIGRELLPREAYVQNSNQKIRQALEGLESKHP